MKNGACCRIGLPGPAVVRGMLIALMGISLIVAPVAAGQIWADSTTFYANEVVTVSGDLDQTSEDSGFPYAARVYVTRDRDTWSYGQGLGDVSGGYNVVLGTSMGSAFISEMVWLPMLQPGRYDIVLDENQNGDYDCDPATGVCDVVIGDPATSGDFAFQVLPSTGAPVVDKAEIKDDAADLYEHYASLPTMVELSATVFSLASTAADYAVAWSPATGMCVSIGISVFESNVVGTSYDAMVTKMGIDILKQIGGPLSDRYQALALDPPDTAFETVADLGAVPYHTPIAEDGFSQAQTDTANALEEQGALVVALTHSLEKLDGALAANDPVAIVRQARMVKTYADLLAANSEDSANQIGTLAGEVKNHGGDRVIRAADVIGYQQHVATSGFSAGELDDMRAAGLTGAEIASFRQYITTMKTEGLADFNEYQVWLDLRDQTTGGIPTLRDISDQAQMVIDYYGYSVDDVYPVASAGGPYAGTEGMAVTLSAAASTDPNGDALSYAWDLDGDGAFDDGSSASVEKTWNGEFRGLVGVRVTDANGHADTAYAPVRIASANRAPVMGATSPEDSVIAAQPGDTVAFSAEATDPDGDTVTFRWYLGGAEVATGPAWTRTVTEADAGAFVDVVADDGSPFSTDPFARWRIAMPGVVAEGPISVTSDPAGAHIMLDGVDTGRVTPAVLDGVSLGEHTVSVSLSGYMVPEAKTVTVTATGTATADFALVSPQFLDTFDDNRLDTGIWTVNQEGRARITEANQQLEVTIPAESTGELISAGVLSRGKIHGDFDIRIGYRVIEWPPHNGVRIGIHFGETGIEKRIMERVSYTENDNVGQEAYTTDYYGGGELRSVPTDDTSGTLRLVRQGGTVTAYYADADTWVPFTSGWTTTGDVSFGFSGWSHDPVFAGEPVRFALDNFVIASGELVFPEGPPVVDAGPDATATEAGSVAFAGSFIDPGDTGAHTVAWDFGDGSTASTLEATHAYADNGAYTATLTVTDTGGLSASDTRTITVANADPVVDAGADQSATAGSTVSFTGTFTDAGTADTHTATWNWGDGSAVTPAAVTGGTVTGTHAYATAGTYTATLAVTDDDGGTGSDTVTVTVTQTNRPPVLDAIGPRTGDELAPITFTATATDPDTGQALAFSLAGAPAGAGITPAGEFSWTPTEAQDGEHTVTVQVSDGELLDTETVTVTVLEVNVAPVLAPIGPITGDEQTRITFTATATDADLPANTLIFSLDGAPQGATITPAGVFSWTPTVDQDGTHTVTVQVSDGALSDSETITVTVNEVNAKPLVDAGADRTGTEGTAVSLAGSYTDDGDTGAHTIAWTFGDGATASDLVTTHVYVDNGVYTATLTITDTGGLSASDEMTVTVANAPPAVDAGADLSATAGNPVSFAGSFTDAGTADTHTFVWSFGDGTSATEQNPTHAYTASGTYTANLAVTDDDGGTGTDSVTVTVTQTNRPPVLDAIGPRTGDELAPITFTATATDPDTGQTLAFSLAGAPAGAGITPAGEFSWTPAEAQDGEHTVTVQVSDGELLDTEIVTVTVLEVNVAPVLAPIGPRTGAGLELLTFTATATDADLPANTLVFSLVGAPAGAAITPAGVFSWTPNGDQDGAHTFTVVVSDGVLSDSETITVTVTQANRAPELGPIGAKTIDEGKPLEFTISATDPDGDALTYTVTGVPAWATFNPATGTFSGTPGFGDAGTARVTFAVSDGTLSDDEEVAITVNNANRAPSLDVIGAKTVGEDEPLEFTIAATDPDGDALTYSASNLPQGAAFNPATRTFTWTPTSTQAGTYHILFTVGDGALSDGENVPITVSDAALDTTPPQIGAIVATPNPAPVATRIGVTVPVTDTGAASTGVASVSCSIDEGPWVAMAAADGSFGGATEVATSTLPAFTSAGVYRVLVRATDGAGNTAVSTDVLFLVVYDPNGGFVTGGGWITSPAGAYPADPAMTGKATFGFVSKYQKGKTLPTGETEFEFHAADFTFHSTSYDWLVIAGAKAQYKGSGTVNGAGDYGFMLTAIDGDVLGKGKPDLFRIKIWDKVSGSTVYDNKMGASDTDDPTTVIGGGSIVVHKK